MPGLRLDGPVPPLRLHAFKAGTGQLYTCLYVQDQNICEPPKPLLPQPRRPEDTGVTGIEQRDGGRHMSTASHDNHITSPAADRAVIALL